MDPKTNGVGHSSGTAPIWMKLRDRNDVDASSAYQHELKTGNAFDFAKKHPELMAELTNAKTSCAGGW